MAGSRRSASRCRGSDRTQPPRTSVVAKRVTRSAAPVRRRESTASRAASTSAREALPGAPADAGEGVEGDMYAPIQKVEGGLYVQIIGGPSPPPPYQSGREHRETLWVRARPRLLGPIDRAFVVVPPHQACL
nr:MAG TPA: hypothetical protein [Caudoviricetes sp.]